ncbi:hypothetical protein DAI22_08g254000 [Oryza sativa Japonica Group]|nr:hypothetical protein DAI22_08g254000 [Oryza sativa Japonica Group]KAF2921013.1 hypothetical protein DAI22_08g254000 [Oryza sativa Japonica Group]
MTGCLHTRRGRAQLAQWQRRRVEAAASGDREFGGGDGEEAVVQRRGGSEGLGTERWGWRGGWWQGEGKNDEDVAPGDGFAWAMASRRRRGRSSIVATTVAVTPTREEGRTRALVDGE